MNSTWKPNIKIGEDYFVSDGWNKYFVPFDLIGEKMDIRLTSQTLEYPSMVAMLPANIRLAVSVRYPIINPDHMTPEHRKYLNYKPRRFHFVGQH